MENYRQLIFLFLLIWACDLQAQDASVLASHELDSLWNDVATRIVDKEKRKECFPLFDEIRKESLSVKDTSSYYTSFTFEAYTYLRMRQFDEMKPVLEKVLQEVDTLGVSHSRAKADYYYVYARYYFRVGMYSSAVFFYEKCLESLLIPDETDGQELKFREGFNFGLQQLLNNIAFVNYELRDYETSLKFYSLQLSISYSELSDVRKSLLYQNIGVSMLRLNRCDEAYDNFQKALRLAQKVEQKENDRNNKQLSLIYKNLAELSLDCKINEDAFYYLNESETYLNPTNKEGYILYLFIQYKANKKLRDINSAQYILKECITLSKEYYGKEHPKVVDYLLEYGQLNLETKELLLAEKVIDEALSILDVLDADAGQRSSNLGVTVGSFQKVMALSLKGDICNANDNYEEAQKYYNAAVDQIYLIQKMNLIDRESKFGLMGKSKEIFSNSIANDIQLGNKHLGFDKCRNGKGLQLLFEIRENELFEKSGIPETTTDRLNYLLQDIKNLQRQYDSLDAQDVRADSIRNLIFFLDNEYTNIMQSLEENHPTYQALKYQVEEMPLPELQRKLSRKEATLIEYFLGDDEMFVFVLDKDGIRHVERISVTDELLDDIRTMNHCVSTLDFSYEVFETYQESSHRLYKQLIGRIEKYIHHKNLIIIPDEQLNLIPFEALVTSDKTFQDTIYARYHQLDYLIDEYDISYHYSSNLIGSQPKSNRKERKDFLGIAPSFRNRTGVQELRNNLMEVESGLIQYAQADTIIGLNATYEEVMSSIGDYRMVHFATHAIFNDRVPLDSRIELADTSIYIYEIFGMDHNLDLAIMSACETASGERKKGEGVISLSRAFIQSGCPSVIASLWSISDQKTSMLMQMFHEYTGAGESPKHSLSEAKRRYIDEAITKNVHPFYWSGFIQIGEVEKPDNRIPNYVWLLGLVLLVLGGGCLARMKK